MKMLKLFTLASTLILASSLTSANAAETLSLDELLKQVSKGRAADSKVNKQREKKFLAEKNNQQKLLKEIKTKQVNLEKQSALMEKQFDVNEENIAKQAELLKIRLG
ncbi:MAG: energy transducer TonB, partial [Gammaproteobacteria bacterium]|nr:energy transducer TonB [Gammaproteobacteria bacterium]